MGLINKNYEFWNGKNVLVTGHTGFKGGWLSIWLSMMGAKISGISLEPNTIPSLYKSARVDLVCKNHTVDIRNYENLKSVMTKISPDIIFHLAAQPLVGRGYRQPIETFETNVMGVANILDVVREIASVKVVVVVTTDKVYEANLHSVPYLETDRLGGKDPYSASKAATEILVNCYRDSYLTSAEIRVVSARAGNVIGGGDWATDRLIPDAVRAWEKSNILDVRNPMALRPWQHVLEPLFGYLTLAREVWFDPLLEGAYNFGPNKNDILNVEEVLNIAKKYFPKSSINLNSKKNFNETPWLLLNSDKTMNKLGVRSIYRVSEAVEKTMQWYSDFRDGQSAFDLCVNDIKSYEDKYAKI